MGSEKHRGSVGATYVEVRVSARVGGRSKPLSLLVDTGSDYCIMPRRVLHALGIKPEERQRFELANGRTIRRDVGIAYLSFRGRVTATNVIFGGSREDTAGLDHRVAIGGSAPDVRARVAHRCESDPNFERQGENRPASWHPLD